MFQELQEKVSAYNEEYGKLGGCAKLQVFQQLKMKENLNSRNTEKALILAICTTLMARVHNHVMQSGEMVFCDATVNLERFNNPLFILSTSSPAGGLPLGIVMTLGESEIVTDAIKRLKEACLTMLFITKERNKDQILF